MATFLLNIGRMNQVKNDINPSIFIKFMFGGKIGMKYEISVSENPFTKFHLNPSKTEKLVKS